MNIKYLNGLDSLRFIAAFFVIISHGAISLNKLGINSELANLVFFNRGYDAVEFFFTLSGFLITYLLIKEYHAKTAISLKNFYLRRIFRIWPLYFLIVTLGFIFLGIILPKITGIKYFEFEIEHGLFYYILFLPNYAILYKVGFMYPLWSIGVEEQFYLFWAPLMKGFIKNIKLLLLFFISFTLIAFILIDYDIINTGIYKKFLVTLKFHNMAIGSFFGYILFYHFEKYDKSFLTQKWVQLIILIVIINFFTLGIFCCDKIMRLLLPILYGMLILNVSVISNKLINLNWIPLLFLGRISYGLYMYHMIIDYILRFTFERLNIQFALFEFIYFILLISLTIFVSSLSFKYLEKPFLNLKRS